jgi:hypothetical protein
MPEKPGDILPEDRLAIGYPGVNGKGKHEIQLLLYS